MISVHIGRFNYLNIIEEKFKKQHSKIQNSWSSSLTIRKNDLQKRRKRRLKNYLAIGKGKVANWQKSIFYFKRVDCDVR